MCVSAASFWKPNHIVESAWLEHGSFAFWIMEALRPRVLVELGTHNGFSYMAFCQAIRQLGLPCSSYAVDTWQGDAHAGFYGEDVFTALSARNDALYADFSRLLRSRFDQALSAFEDGSVDVLHIDGRHTYEDVREDFETWRPKLSPRGVVLFHDTTVRFGDFGVWRFWAEISQRYPSFEFLHGHGLGVLAVGDEAHAMLKLLFDAQSGEVAAVRSAYERLGQGISQDHVLEALGARFVEAEAALGRMSETFSLTSAHLCRANECLLSTGERLSSTIEQLATAHERLSLIESSLTWRATKPARRLLAALPASVRQTLRLGAKAVWWAVTPHRIPGRMALLRARANAVRRHL